MPFHRFAVGQSVRLVTNAGVSRKVAGSYSITRFLPERDRSPQYRLSSEDGLHERVAMEDAIEPAAPENFDIAIVQSGKR